jgi:WS/DGAT/MGAT family acyltransferase
MARAAGDVFRKSVRRISSTPLNQPIGPHRRFDWVHFDLAALKVVRRALGGSVNDIVLAIVTGGVRRYLERHGTDINAVTFRVMTPVSIRTADERGTLGNRVSAWLVDLPISELDPRRCVARLTAITERLKESNQALGADMLARAMNWTPSTLLATSSRMITPRLPFNLVVTNVPGPQQPLYLLGSRMLANYGVLPLIEHTGLGIVVFSYAGGLTFGLAGDWDTVPDLHLFAQALREAFRELERASEPLSAGPPGTRAEPAGAR